MIAQVRRRYTQVNHWLGWGGWKCRGKRMRQLLPNFPHSVLKILRELFICFFPPDVLRLPLTFVGIVNEVPKMIRELLTLIQKLNQNQDLHTFKPVFFPCFPSCWWRKWVVFCSWLHSKLSLWQLIGKVCSHILDGKLGRNTKPQLITYKVLLMPAVFFFSLVCVKKISNWFGSLCFVGVYGTENTWTFLLKSFFFYVEFDICCFID